MRHQVQQLLAVGMLRRVEKRFCRGDFQELVMAHHADPVAHLPNDGKIVADE